MSLTCAPLASDSPGNRRVSHPLPTQMRCNNVFIATLHYTTSLFRLKSHKILYVVMPNIANLLPISATA